MCAEDLKEIMATYLEAMRRFSHEAVGVALERDFADDVLVRLCYPFGDLNGSQEFLNQALLPLQRAMPDLERRDMILMAGTTGEGQHWVGTMGNYMGTFSAPFLDIPATGHLAHMRYHEFFQIENNKIVQMQAIWDLPELMMLANVWPMAPQLGAFLCTPGPLKSDGLSISGNGETAMQHVLAMLEDMCRFPGNPDPAIMQLEKYWHSHCNWYGPAGIGTARGISGFRHWHQIPFLNAMPDRRLDNGAALMSHWVAEGDYVCETGWPNMRLTLTGNGWMGIAPANREVTLRSLDFWQLEDGLIRENWVLVDLLDMYAQLNVDVLGRLREFNKARVVGRIELPG